MDSGIRGDESNWYRNHQDNILTPSSHTIRLADSGLASVTAAGAKFPGFSFSAQLGEGMYA